MNANVNANAELVDFVTAAPTTGSLDVAWHHGAPSKRRAAAEAPIQIHRYDEHTVILRQSKTLNYEAPFIFLLFGNERALLLDTGATEDPAVFPLRATVDDLVAAWLAEHPREEYGLVVAHTHAHGDHVAADGQFADRPATTVVGHDEDAVRAFFGFGEQWHTETVTFDLGGRVLDVLGTPGHHATAITLYDRWTGILFTGDTILPGRLYASDFTAFLATTNRLVDFAADHPVTHVLGCHIEMKRRPRRDYPLGATYQPDECALEFTPRHLTVIRDAAASVAAEPGVHAFDDFIIYNEPTKADARRLLARARLHQLRTKVWPFG